MYKHYYINDNQTSIPVFITKFTRKSTLHSLAFVANSM